jgi:hypothetical protein
MLLSNDSRRVFLQKRRRSFAADADAGDVINRIAAIAKTSPIIGGGTSHLAITSCSPRSA